MTTAKWTIDSLAIVQGTSLTSKGEEPSRFLPFCIVEVDLASHWSVRVTNIGPDPSVSSPRGGGVTHT